MEDSLLFGMEKRLRELDPALHRRFTDAVPAVWNMLFRYKRYFPEYNDHSGLHSMGVMEYCSLLAGQDQVPCLNGDELYVLLMSCLLHDAGMGISPEEFEEFIGRLDLEEYFRKEGRVPRDRIIRDFHQEFSALLIDRYADFLELPSPEHLFAVKQVVRGHRKADLFDAGEFPSDFMVPGGSRICLPYLALLIRLADEIDVTSLRSTDLLYDVGSFESPDQVFYYKRTRACRKVEVTGEAIILHVTAGDPEVEEGLKKMRGKIQETLDLCREAAEKRTPFKVTQSRVVLKESPGDMTGEI